MSLSFKVGGIFGGPLDDSVISQLQQRKNIIGKRTSRSSDDIIYLNSNTGWVRVTSSVNLPDSGGSELAKKYTLFNSIQDATEGFNPRSPNTSYTESTTYGFIPAPGITQFSVKSKGLYGALREISFSFTAHSPEDFSILEQLYLRPGYTILVEWGHSIILDDQGNISTNVKYFDKEKFLNYLPENDIQKAINELKTDNFNNYDALFGFIKNFSWTYNGYSYECVVEVISKGELLNSIKSAYAKAEKSDDETQDPNYSSKAFSSGLTLALSAIQAAPSQDYFTEPDVTASPEEITLTALNFLDLAGPGYKGALTDLRVAIGSLSGNTDSNDSKWLKYIPLRNFLQLVNRGSLLKNQEGENLVEFYTGGSTPTPFTTFPEHISLDPYICILPKKSSTGSFIWPFSKQITDLEEDETLNILVSVSYLIKCIEDVQNAEDSLDDTLYNLLIKILGGIQANLGDINDFGINYVEEEDLFYIIDRNVIPSKLDFQRSENNLPKSYIDLVGLNSEVENLNINSKLSEKLTSMIAIAAQASSNPSAAFSTLNLHKWNQGIVDRHLPIKNVALNQNIQSENTTVKENPELRKQYLKFLEKVSVENNNYYIGYDREVFTKYKVIHKQLMGEFLSKITENRNLNNPGLVPFELSFTIKGISGLKIGQAFKVNEFFLPERYRGRVGFLIVGLDHNVTDGRWTTDVRTQITVL